MLPVRHGLPRDSGCSLLAESASTFAQAPAGFLLLPRQDFERGLVANAGQVGVGLPLLEGLPHCGFVLGFAGLGLLGPVSQVGLEPRERLPPALRSQLLRQRWLVVALARACQRRTARGVVTISRLRVFRQFRVGLEGLSVQPD